MKNMVLKVHPNDNVVVALKDLKKGESVVLHADTFELIENIPAKHKFYTEDLSKGSEVIMYGVLVGKVTQDVKRGGCMTTENLRHAAEAYAYRNVNYQWTAPDVTKWKHKNIHGLSSQ